MNMKIRRMDNNITLTLNKSVRFFFSSNSRFISFFCMSLFSISNSLFSLDKIILSLYKSIFSSCNSTTLFLYHWKGKSSSIHTKKSQSFEGSYKKKLTMWPNIKVSTWIKKKRKRISYTRELGHRMKRRHGFFSVDELHIFSCSPLL